MILATIAATIATAVPAAPTPAGYPANAFMTSAKARDVVTQALGPVATYEGGLLGLVHTHRLSRAMFMCRVTIDGDQTTTWRARVWHSEGPSGDSFFITTAIVSVKNK